MSNSKKIIQDVHADVQAERARKGLPPWNFGESPSRRTSHEVIRELEERPYFDEIAKLLKPWLKKEEHRLVEQLKRCKEIQNLIKFFQEFEP